MIRGYCRFRASIRFRCLLKLGPLRPPDGPLSRGREAPPDQDDMHELLRAERAPRDPLSEVRQQGAAAKSEGSAAGVIRPRDPVSQGL